MPLADEYDVFFSYGWADRTGNPAFRDWCQTVAKTIGILLSQRFNASGPPFTAYLDRDVMRAGEDIPEVIEKAVKRSSVLVAMVSDYYDTAYCCSELDWHFERMRSAELDPADHLCILRVQGSRRDWWPPQLKGVHGRRLSYIDLCDANLAPLEMTNFVMNQPMPGLAKSIGQAVLDIGEKLELIRRQRAAKAAFVASQRPPTEPIVFFEAEETDSARWSHCLPHLKEVPSIVLPGPKDASAVSAFDFEGCDGLVMLRSRSDDGIGFRIRQAYLHRRTLLRQNKPNLPWVLLDELEVPPPDGESFKVPRVYMEDGWVDSVRRMLWG